MTRRRAYLLMPWGRVGSNVLLEALRQSPFVMVENEPLTRIRSLSESPDSDQKEWYENSLSHPPQKPVHVINLSLKSMVDPDYFLERFSDEAGTSFIFLERLNLAHIALSVIKAEHYNELHRKEYGVSSWAVRKGREMDAATPLDPKRFLDLMREVEQDQLLFDRFYRRLCGTRIRYEDIRMDLRMVVEEVCGLLGIPVPHYQTTLVKAIRRPYAEEFEGFDALVATVSRKRPELMRYLS